MAFCNKDFMSSADMVEECQHMDFFCTCGRGTELFAVAEISQMMNEELEKISIRDGKVFFTVKHRIHKASFFVEILLQLKSVERIFVEVFHQPDMKLFSQKQAVWKLKSEVQRVDSAKWESCFELWKTIRSADELNSLAAMTKFCGAPSTVSNKKPESDNSQQLGMMENGELEKRGQKRTQDDEVTFRVSAKCSGTAAFWFTPQSLSRVVGCEIARISGWKPELRKPMLEISIQLNHDGLIVGLPCTRVPLSSRPYIKNPGLRTTISSMMVFLAALEPEMVVLDPMCGMGTILIEAAKSCTDVLCIGCDRNSEQCYRSMENVCYSKESARILLMQADVSDIPVADESVDVIVCDIPFGIKHEAPVDVAEKYRLMLLSFDRVLKRESRIVLLCGANLKDVLLKTVTELFSSQAQTPCSPSAYSPPSSALPEGIDSSDKELHKCNPDFTCSPHSKSCHSNTLKPLDKSMKYKDGSLEHEQNIGEKNQSDSVGHEREDKAEHQNFINCGTQGYRNLKDTNRGDTLDDGRSSCSHDISTVSASAFERMTPLNKVTLGTIARLRRRPPLTLLHNCQDHSLNCSMINRSVWITELVHYMKLGETHAYLCVFSTKKCNVQ